MNQLDLRPMSKKLIIGLVLFVAVLFTGIPRFLAVDVGLPYNQYYDEPKITQGALNGSLMIVIDQSQVYQLKVRLVNDYWDPETGEDRNAYFKTLMLKKDVIMNE